ncbi:MAG: hypothetical protein DMG13_32710 [Acidobacteria bacterium]|nr:MAG: hypothetical protein DMG13_32710 [Acidobacteriota bacterium]
MSHKIALCLLDERERPTATEISRWAGPRQQLRRRLPKGPAVEDYVFEEVPVKLDEGDKPVRTARLSQLFTGPDRSVVIYQFMYGKKQTKPCPMCTAWIDSCPP